MRYVVRYHDDDDNSVIPERFGAYITWGVIINIRDKYRDDEGLHQHEYLHVRRAVRSLFYYWWKYKRNEGFRYRAELECYRKQLQYPPASLFKDRMWYINKFANFICMKYGLDVDHMKVVKDLSK